MKFDLIDLKNKDVKEMTRQELNEFNSYVTSTRSNARTASKAKLFKLIYNIVSGICSLLVAYFIYRSIICFLYVRSELSTNIILTIISFIPMIVLYFVWNHKEKEAVEISNICSDKLDEIRKQKNLLDLKETIALEKAEKAKLKSIEKEEALKKANEQKTEEPKKAEAKPEIKEELVEEKKVEKKEKLEAEEQPKKNDSDKKKEEDFEALSREIQELKALLKKQNEKSDDSKKD